MISIHRNRLDKPHIFFHEGYWRVTLSTGGIHSRLKPWHKAHAFINPWNRFNNRDARLKFPFIPLGAYICECTEVDYCEGCLEKMSRDNSSSNASHIGPQGTIQQTSWVHGGANQDCSH